ncbi:MAG: penicillin-binding protein 2, partial [Clostridiales bacterium]|nr:penicillin-binding protein 2 [Clostridiales bacterium]
NMERLTDETAAYYAVLRPIEQVLAELPLFFEDEQRLDIIERLQSGYPILERVTKRTVSSDYIAVVKVNERYSDYQMLSHLIGVFSENEDNMSGLEKSYHEWLRMESTLKVKYSTDARGRLLSGDDGEWVEENYDSQRGVQLTIDKEIQQICEDVVNRAEWFDKGAVVVLDVETSKILAMVSQPALNLNNLAESLEDENGPFINRATTAYSAGSVFKLAIAAAGLEAGLMEHSYTCTGSIEINGTTFNCLYLSGHGSLDIWGAISTSCNTFFIDYGQKIGGTQALDMTMNFNFGNETELASAIVSSAGNLPSDETLQVPGALANFSFGQGELLTTPLQIANMVACIANGGTMNQPYLVEALIDDDGSVAEEMEQAAGANIISDVTSRLLQDYMVETVETGTGGNAKPEEGGAGGKTATAQSGSFLADGTEILHTWFAGFYPADNPKYAIAVFKEDGTSGSSDCCPIFKEIADLLYEL